MVVWLIPCCYFYRTTFSSKSQQRHPTCHSTTTRPAQTGWIAGKTHGRRGRAGGFVGGAGRRGWLLLLLLLLLLFFFVVGVWHAGCVFFVVFGLFLTIESTSKSRILCWVVALKRLQSQKMQFADGFWASNCTLMVVCFNDFVLLPRLVGICFKRIVQPSLRKWVENTRASIK